MEGCKLVGLAGGIGVGKDTVATYMAARGYITYAFADPLKEAASKMFGIPLENFYDRDEKEALDPFWGISPREILQKLGTEGGRQLFFEDIWVRRAESEYLRVCENSKRNKFGSVEGFCVTDIRFDDEAEWVRSEGGKVVHIIRDTDDKPKSEHGIAGHASEAGLKLDKRDFVIYNNGTLNDLQIVIDELIFGEQNPHYALYPDR